MHQNPTREVYAALRRSPNAAATVHGGAAYPSIRGMVWFYQLKNSVLVVCEMMGLPRGGGPCELPVFAFHLHEGSDCSHTLKKPFAGAGEHYNPKGCPHPSHAGDFPVLFGNDGDAFLAFLTDRFRVSDVVGRTVIVHREADDYRTQPAGGAGDRIACGVIVAS